MASYISGKFAIGKIDCTVQTTLCKDPKFNIKGYPTLKIYKDGNIYDYSGKRDADSMIGFMEKMSMPSVQLIDSHQDFVKTVLLKDDGNVDDHDDTSVVFLAFDSKAKQIQIQHETGKKNAEVTSVERYIASTNFLQIYGQTARILQSSTTFALLHPSKFAEVSKFLESSGSSSSSSSSSSSGSNIPINVKKNQPFLLRIEKGTRPMIYDKDEFTSENVMEWVKEHTMPLVMKLEGHNFRTVSALGKPLVIGIINNDENNINEELSLSFRQELLNLAQDGPSDIIQKYKFTQMNGKKFHSFLSQFNITTDSRIPQAIVVNVSNRTFYQNDTYETVHELLVAIEKGEIQEQNQQENGGLGMLQKIRFWFVSNMPISLVIVVLSILVIALIFATVMGDDEDEENESAAVTARVKAQKQLAEIRKEKIKRKTMKED